jgi:hypothetical protein
MERTGQWLARRTGRDQQGIDLGKDLARLFRHFLPSGVSEIDLVLRSIRAAPRYSSRFLIWVLKVG